MSDLSLPPLSLVPLDSQWGPPKSEAPADEPFAWPTPPFAAFAAPTCQIQPEPCEIEGPNGKVTRGQLAFVNLDDGVIQVQVPPARGNLPLRLSQFRRLTLLRPISPLVAPLVSPPASPPGQGQAATTLDGICVQSCQLRFRSGEAVKLETVGHVDHPMGVFLFPPQGDQGRVLRSFYPRAGLAGADMGPRLGQVLIDQQSATTDQVERAAAEQQLLRERKLGDLLLLQQIVTPEQLVQAIDQQARMPMVRIGEALRALGFVTESQLVDALLQQQADRSLPIGELLVRSGAVSRADLQTALARKMGYPMVDVTQFEVEPEAALKLPLSVARRLPALPLMLRGGRLVVAFEDPSVRSVLDEAEFSAQCKIVPVLARVGALLPAVERAYQRLGQQAGQAGPELVLPSASHDSTPDTTNRLLASLELQQTSSDREDDAPIEQSDNSLVRLINTMIIEAQHGGVSDIHIECQPGNQKVRIRFRRDGMLKPYIELPPSYRSALVARIKIMCDLDISERRKPQDGKISFGKFAQGQNLELRVATIPTANNLEDVVMRLLSSARAIPLDSMGLAPATLAGLKAVVERPYGMVLCVGPTGSGKTTTLHAALGHINTPDRKIWTAEDPVEITQPGLRQVQVNPKIEWTFAKALRAFLRADPDVVMVGEIRDRETAQVAIEASLTGHLVLSTLHTNSAPETVTRLLDMGMDPFSFADSLLAVLAQRLVKRLCRHCTTSRPATSDEIGALVHEHLSAFPDPARRPPPEQVLADWKTHASHNGVLMHHHAPGCAHCGHSGYSGRAGLHELLVVDRELRHLIQTTARSEELQSAAMGSGMRTLRQDGIAKVLAGITSIAEVRSTSNA